jgi:hypothetical protein
MSGTLFVACENVVHLVIQHGVIDWHDRAAWVAKDVLYAFAHKHFHGYL